MRRHSRQAISANMRFEVLRRCNFACYYCGVPAAMGMKQLHIDHVIPVSLGGQTHSANLVAACWDCNLGKTNGVPTDEMIRAVVNDHCAYMESLGFRVTQCRHCHTPIQFMEDEEFDADMECGTCNDVFITGYEAGYRRASEVDA